MSDLDLLKDLQAGKEAALTSLIEKYQDLLIAYLFCLCQDMALAKDLCQDSFIMLLKKPPRKISDSGLKAWLFQVAKNKYVDHFRKVSRKIEGNEKQGLLSPAEHLIKMQEQEIIQKTLEALPNELRETVQLRIYEDMKFKEISAKMNVPMGTVLWRMKRALELLKHKIKGEIYE